MPFDGVSEFTHAFFFLAATHLAFGKRLTSQAQFLLRAGARVADARV
jgi:hypothetical protein